MENAEKFVDFNTYCQRCEYANLDAADDPCNECLAHPVNTYSRRPVRYKEVKHYGGVQRKRTDKSTKKTNPGA